MHKAWWCLEEVPYCFQGHPSNFKVTWLKKLSILTQIGHFWTVTQVWIHWWIWNDAQSLMKYRRCALLFWGVIHQISRSHRLKNRRFESNLSKITRPVAAIKSLRFALFIVNLFTSRFWSNWLKMITLPWNLWNHHSIHTSDYKLSKSTSDDGLMGCLSTNVIRLSVI